MTLAIILLAVFALLQKFTQKTNYAWSNAGGMGALNQNNFKSPGRFDKFKHDMKIKWSGLGMTDGSGKIGGNVAAKNRNGSYLRRKGQVLNPNTAAQIIQRAIFGALSSAWRGLTAAQRAAWTALGISTTDQFGDPQTLTGLQSYQRLNGNLDTIGFASIQDAPVLESGPDAVSITDSGATLEITAATIDNLTTTISNPASNAGDFTCVVRATPSQSPGRTAGSVKNLYRIIDSTSITINTGTSSTFAAAGADFDAIYAAYVALFGVPVVGNKVFFQVDVVDQVTGQLFPALAWECVVVA